MYHSPLDRCAAHRSHTAAWLVDFPCGFAKAADNQSHSLICRPLLLHLLTRKHCRGPWESCTEYLLQALGKKSPVYKSVDHSGQKIRVTPRPDSCVLEGGGWSKTLHTPPTLATLLPSQDAAAQLDRSSADTGLRGDFPPPSLPSLPSTLSQGHFHGNHLVV